MPLFGDRGDTSSLLDSGMGRQNEQKANGQWKWKDLIGWPISADRSPHSWAIAATSLNSVFSDHSCAYLSPQRPQRIATMNRTVDQIHDHNLKNLAEKLESGTKTSAQAFCGSNPNPIKFRKKK